MHLEVSVPYRTLSNQSSYNHTLSIPNTVTDSQDHCRQNLSNEKAISLYSLLSIFPTLSLRVRVNTDPLTTYLVRFIKVRYAMSFKFTAESLHSKRTSVAAVLVHRVLEVNKCYCYLYPLLQLAYPTISTDYRWECPSTSRTYPLSPVHCLACRTPPHLYPYIEIYSSDTES